MICAVFGDDAGGAFRCGGVVCVLIVVDVGAGGGVVCVLVVVASGGGDLGTYEYVVCVPLVYSVGGGSVG